MPRGDAYRPTAVVALSKPVFLHGVISVAVIKLAGVDDSRYRSSGSRQPGHAIVAKGTRYPTSALHSTENGGASFVASQLQSHSSAPKATITRRVRQPRRSRFAFVRGSVKFPFSASENQRTEIRSSHPRLEFVCLRFCAWLRRAMRNEDESQDPRKL
jgi:hypothetical protein